VKTRCSAWLFWLIVANIVASIIHFSDNVAFFSIYPEPGWNSAGATDLYWFVMTPLAIGGYFAYRSGWFWRSTALLHVYALMSLLVLGHYAYAPLCSISPRIHFTVLVEAGAALVLMAGVLFQQWRRISSLPSDMG
jgi:hypothetical protein